MSPETEVGYVLQFTSEYGYIVEKITREPVLVTKNMRQAQKRLAELRGEVTA